MPILKAGQNRLTDAQVKAAHATKGGVSALGVTNEGSQANLVVIALAQALPDRRVTEANRLLKMIAEPGGKSVVWDQLCRTHKPLGNQAGLKALVEMLGAKADKFVAVGQEPAAQILSSLCTRNEAALVISKQKKVLHHLVSILGAQISNDTTRRAASWVLRRISEVSPRTRIELGSDREALQTLGKIMCGDSFGATDSESLLSHTNSRAGSRLNSAARSPSNARVHSNARSPSPTSFDMRNQSAASSREQFSSMPPRMQSQQGAALRRTPSPSALQQENTNLQGAFSSFRSVRSSGSSKNVRATSPSTTLDTDVPHGTRGIGEIARTNSDASFLSNASSGIGRSRTTLHSAAPPPSKAGERPMLNWASDRHFQSGSSFSASLGSIKANSRPKTAESAGEIYFMGMSRPGTALGVGTAKKLETDPMCVQGNCACAIGNMCYSDEVIDRVVKTENVLAGILHLLQNGTEWAAGHAARSLGNMAYSLESCKYITAVDQSNTAIIAIMQMIISPHTSKRTKELSVHALGNLSRSSSLCTRLNGFTGLFEELDKLVQEDSNCQHDVDRAITNLSQNRLGTHTWRQPTRI